MFIEYEIFCLQSTTLKFRSKSPVFLGSRERLTSLNNTSEKLSGNYILQSIIIEKIFLQLVPFCRGHKEYSCTKSVLGIENCTDGPSLMYV